MPLTPEQRASLMNKAKMLNQPQKGGLTQQQKDSLNRKKTEMSVSSVVGLSPLTSSTSIKPQVNTVDAKPSESLLKTAGKAIASSILTAPARALTNVANVGETVYDLSRAGVSSLKGDKEKANKYIAEAGKDIEKSRTLPIVGKVKPVGISGGLRGVADIIGTGADIGTSLVGGATGGKAIGTIGKQSIGKITLKTGKIGLKTGITGEASQLLQRIGKKEEGTAVEELGNIALSGILGVGVGAGIGVSSELAKRVGKVLVREIKPLSNIIEKGTGYKIGNRLKTEEMLGRTKDLGIDEKVVKLADKSDESFKKDALKIIDQTIQKKADSNVASPLHVTVGKKLEKDLGEVLSLKERAGQGISQAKRIIEKDKKEIDVSSVANKFIKRLKNSGVKINDNKLDFKGSDIAQGSAQDTKILSDIFDFLTPDKDGKTIKSAKDLVNFRTRTLAEEKLYKARNELTKGEGLLSSVDSDFLRLLRPISKEYYDNTVNYAKSSKILNDFKKLLGDQYADEEIVQGKLGDFSRRLINRYSSDTKGKLKDLYVGLHSLGKNIDPNKELQKISDLVDLSDIAEKAIGKAPASSAIETVKSGSEQALKAVIEPRQAVVEGFKKAVQSTFGKTKEEIEKEKIKVLKTLFKLK